jgi:hypothetical protein
MFAHQNPYKLWKSAKIAGDWFLKIQEAMVRVTQLCFLAKSKAFRMHVNIPSDTTVLI